MTFRPRDFPDFRASPVGEDRGTVLVPYAAQRDTRAVLAAHLADGDSDGSLRCPRSTRDSDNSSTLLADGDSGGVWSKTTSVHGIGGAALGPAG
eukprot:7010613-Pyramimonas_sp.AAC.1